jgi:hypothetical protein
MGKSGERIVLDSDAVAAASKAGGSEADDVRASHIRRLRPRSTMRCTAASAARARS